MVRRSWVTVAFLHLLGIGALGWAQGASPNVATYVDHLLSVKWQSTRDLDSIDQRALGLIEGGKATEARRLLEKSVQAGTNDPIKHSLLLSAVSTRKDLKAFGEVKLVYEKLRDRPRDSETAMVEDLAYARVLITIADNRPTSATEAAATRAKVKTILSRYRTRAASEVWISVQIADDYMSWLFDDIVEARKTMVACVARLPKSVPAHYYLMMLYWTGFLDGEANHHKVTEPPERHPDPARELEQARKVIDLEPNFPDTYFYGGTALLQLGDKREAKRWLQRFVAIQPTGPQAAIAKKLLAKL